MSQQNHILPDCDWQHITFTMLQLLCPFFNNNWHLLNVLFLAVTRAMLRWARKQSVEVGIFCALHAYGRQLNQYSHIHLSVLDGLDIKYGVWRELFFKKHAVEESWRSMATRLLRHSYAPAPTACRGWGIFTIKSSDSAIFRRCTDAAGRSTLRRRPAEPGKYLSRYLKRPPVSAAKLRYYSSGAVVHHYYDHRTEQTLSQEELIGCCISNIPVKHFKIVRY